MTERLLPCPFCGAPGFAMLASFGFRIKCTNTDCTIETPIKTHRHQVDKLWNRRAQQVGTEALRDAQAFFAKHVQWFDENWSTSPEGRAYKEQFEEHVAALSAADQGAKT